MKLFKYNFIIWCSYNLLIKIKVKLIFFLTINCENVK